MASRQYGLVTRGQLLAAGFSPKEMSFLRRLGDQHLPLPETNRPAGGRRVDCRWPEHRLRGDEFRRFTWADVIDSPDYMLAELRRLLAQSRHAARLPGRAA
jgi:hypothetical protein